MSINTCWASAKFEVDKRHMRIGFAWPGAAELERGLAAITQALDDACRT